MRKRKTYSCNEKCNHPEIKPRSVAKRYTADGEEVVEVDEMELVDGAEAIEAFVEVSKDFPNLIGDAPIE